MRKFFFLKKIKITINTKINNKKKEKKTIKKINVIR